jgi:hypothetical protein
MAIPAGLAFAGTVQRSQDMTLGRAVIGCRSEFWSHGPLYVALSRVQNPIDFCILLLPEPENRCIKVPADYNVVQVVESMRTPTEKELLTLTHSQDGIERHTFHESGELHREADQLDESGGIENVARIDVMVETDQGEEADEEDESEDMFPPPEENARKPGFEGMSIADDPRTLETSMANGSGVPSPPLHAFTV